jgi:hypothetical protein
VYPLLCDGKLQTYLISTIDMNGGGIGLSVLYNLFMSHSMFFVICINFKLVTVLRSIFKIILIME